MWKRILTDTETCVLGEGSTIKEGITPALLKVQVSATLKAVATADKTLSPVQFWEQCSILLILCHRTTVFLRYCKTIAPMMDPVIKMILAFQPTSVPAESLWKTCSYVCDGRIMYMSPELIEDLVLIRCYLHSDIVYLPHFYAEALRVLEELAQNGDEYAPRAQPEATPAPAAACASCSNSGR